MDDINIRGRYEDLVVLSLMSHITLRSGEDGYSAVTLRVLMHCRARAGNTARSELAYSIHGELRPRGREGKRVASRADDPSKHGDASDTALRPWNPLSIVLIMPVGRSSLLPADRLGLGLRF